MKNFSLKKKFDNDYRQLIYNGTYFKYRNKFFYFPHITLHYL